MARCSALLALYRHCARRVSTPVTPLCRYEMVDQQKREMKKKAELEKRFKQNGDKADGAADGAEGDATDTDSDEEDDDKITEAQDAGGWRSHA